MPGAAVRSLSRPVRFEARASRIWRDWNHRHKRANRGRDGTDAPVAPDDGPKASFSNMFGKLPRCDCKTIRPDTSAVFSAKPDELPSYGGQRGMSVVAQASQHATGKLHPQKRGNGQQQERGPFKMPAGMTEQRRRVGCRRGIAWVVPYSEPRPLMLDITANRGTEWSAPASDSTPPRRSSAPPPPLILGWEAVGTPLITVVFAGHSLDALCLYPFISRSVSVSSSLSSPPPGICP